MLKSAQQVSQRMNTADETIVDGGFADWTAGLLANRKERLLISGIGSEFVCKTCRPGSSSTPTPGG
jgi:hypothetical protein